MKYLEYATTWTAGGLVRRIRVGLSSFGHAIQGILRTHLGSGARGVQAAFQSPGSVSNDRREHLCFLRSRLTPCAAVLRRLLKELAEDY